MENINQIKQQQELDAIIASIVGDTNKEQVIELELPSRGYGYTFTDGSTKVKVKPMTFADEKTILSAGKTGADPVSVLLNRCVLNLQINKTYIFDKLFLLLKIRELSYGGSYQAAVHCPSCNKENNLDIKIGSLLINYINDDFTDPMEVTLPVAGKKVLIKHPKVEDEQYLGTFEKSTSNLWRFIVSIDGHNNSVVINKVLEKLHLKDVNTIIKSVINSKYGVVPSVKMECVECNKLNTLDLPISADFFMGN